MKKASSKLIQLKNKALEAYFKGMLPSALVSAINGIKCENGIYSANVDYVEFLKELTLDMLRVKGYYKNDVKMSIGNRTVKLAIETYKKKKGG